MIEEIIKALRCEVPKKGQCEGCKYRILEPIDSNFPCPTDVIIDGIEYWESCDVDRICKDAADELNKLVNLKETIQQIHDNVYQEAYQKGLKDGQMQS